MKDFFGILSAVLGRGAIMAFIRLLLDRRKETRERAETIRYLTIRLAFQFEAFAVNSAVAIADHQNANENHGHVGNVLNAVPPPLPESDAYRFLKPDLLNEVFAFSQRCQMAQESAYFWIDVVGDSDCYNTAVEENTIIVADDSLKIARAIRKANNLGERQLKFDKWDINEFITKQRDKVEIRNRRRDQQEHEDHIVDRPK